MKDLAEMTVMYSEAKRDLHNAYSRISQLEGALKTAEEAFIESGLSGFASAMKAIRDSKL